LEGDFGRPVNCLFSQYLPLQYLPLQYLPLQYLPLQYLPLQYLLSRHPLSTPVWSRCLFGRDACLVEIDQVDARASGGLLQASV
jgi:hypothetical protein